MQFLQKQNKTGFFGRQKNPTYFNIYMKSIVFRIVRKSFSGRMKWKELYFSLLKTHYVAVRVCYWQRDRHIDPQN